MTNGHEKSDSVIVAVKPANKVAHPAAEQSAAEPATAEPVEPRAGTKGNAGQQTMPWAQSQTSMPHALERIREVARERKKEKFISLFHHISVDLLEDVFYELNVDAAPGVDRLMWKDYEADLERNLEDLHNRVQSGAYRARPSRRVYIPKPDGRQRPLAVAALEDKIVQRAVVALLNAIYEEDFLGISYGFRPGRSTHDAGEPGAWSAGSCDRAWRHDERDRQAGRVGFPGGKAPTWLSNRGYGVPSILSLPSIGCSPPSSNRLTTFWFLIGFVLSAAPR
jgi:RNA-directed DNA polymerase